MTFEWKLFIRDNRFRHQGEIFDYEEASFTPTFNDVGPWRLKINRTSPAAVMLNNPDWGIEAWRNGVQMFSGIWTEVRHTQGMDSNQLEILGGSDEIWLRDRLVSPSPGESVAPYTVQASSVISGVASTVLIAYVNLNLGPGAVVTRRKSLLTMATDPAIGSTVKGEGRWDADVLSFLQPLAITGNVGFRVVQVGTALQFQVYRGVDRSSSVKFSTKLGNLAGFEYSRTRPKANYVYVGASGSGTARIIKEFSDNSAVATWERIEGQLANASSTSDTTVIAQAGADALATGSEQVSLSITPVETQDMMYGVHYNIGDTVAIQLDNPATTPYAESGQVVDVVRAVTINLTPKGPQTVTPTIGTPAKGNVSKLVRAFQQATRRLNNLERS
jgi:hypothetical protein